MKDINIVGCCFNDTVLYLARILRCLERKLIIRDMTRSHCFLSSVPDIRGLDPRREVIDYLGAGYTFGDRNGRFGEEGSRYDTCIRLYDSDMLPDYHSDTIIITDETKLSVDRLSSLCWEKDEKSEYTTVLFIRNYTGAVRSQFDELIKKTSAEKVYPIPVSVSDTKCSVLAEYKDDFRFSTISAAYREALLETLISVCRDTSLKELQRAFRQAEKGGGDI